MDSKEALKEVESSGTEVVDKVVGWGEHAVQMLPNLAVAIVVVFVFFGLARLSRRVTRKGLGHITQAEQVIGLVSKVVQLAMVATGVFVALSVLELEKTVSSLLAGLGIMGLAVGFALQDGLANFASGVTLAIRRPFEVGDMIETNGVTGNVQELRLTATLIRTFQAQEVWIPNKEVLHSVLTNFTRSGQRRIDVDVGVSYGDDLQAAEDACREALEGLQFRMTDKPVDVWYTGFGDSSIGISARVWIDLKGDVDFLKARSEAVKALKAAFDAADLTIPFPIRTLDFGIHGGERMRDHLSVLQGGARDRNATADESPHDDSGARAVPARRGTG